MAIKIKASNNQSSKKIQIQKCAGLMPVIFHNTANDSRYRIYLTSNLLLRDIYRLLLDLSIIIDPPAHFVWKMYSNSSELDYSLTLYENHISKDSEIEVSCVEIPYVANVEIINVKIVKGIGGADCDIDVPIDATVGDVIAGLINESFLEVESPTCRYEFYNMDTDGGIYSGLRYDDRRKTIKEYGWKKGQTLVAVSPSIDGCGLLISIRLPNSNEIEIRDAQCYDCSELFEELAKQVDFDSFPVSKNDMSFYYLYDEVSGKMIIRSKEMPAYSDCKLPEPPWSGYAKLKSPLLLLRQVVEKIQE